MTRSLVGIVVVLAWSVTAGVTAAKAEPRVQAARTKDQASITLRDGALRVTQTLTRRAFTLQLTEGKDTVQLSGDLAGHLVVEHGGKRHAFSMRRPTAADEAAVFALLESSAAIQSFDALMGTRWAGTAKIAPVFRAAHSMLGLLRGDQRSVVALMATATATPKASLIPARRDGPSDCWDSYTHDVVRYTFDLEACVAEARDSYFPLHLGWCAYEYNIKASLAFMWLLNCTSIL